MDPDLGGAIGVNPYTEPLKVPAPFPEFATPTVDPLAPPLIAGPSYGRKYFALRRTEIRSLTRCE